MYGAPMHIDIVPNRDSRPTFLLRESYRDGSRVRKRTLANLSALNEEQIEAIRAVLRGEPLRPVGELFEVVSAEPKLRVIGRFENAVFSSLRWFPVFFRTAFL